MGGKMHLALPAGTCSAWIRWLAILLLVVTAAGCASPPLQTARANFYVGRFSQANENLKDVPTDDKDAALYLMERGMIRHSQKDYDGSSADWREAAEIIRLLETYSVSRGVGSLLSSDMLLSFRGMPFERTMIYTFLAKNYFAQYNWDYAAISARNIIRHVEDLDGFPDIPYSRYMAGFCMEMIDDEGNAAIQYKIASQLLGTNNFYIDEDTGDIYPLSPAATNALTVTVSNLQGELVCFVSLGRMPVAETPAFYASYSSQLAPYAEFYVTNSVSNIYLGRSYPFANTAELMQLSKKRMAAIQLAKDATRIALKVVIAETLADQNEFAGLLAWMILFAMERPDTRAWETLPLWLEIARVPCPADLSSFNIVFRTAHGTRVGEKTVTNPIVRRGPVFISFCRDIDQ